MKNKVSVIIRTFNEEKKIGRCLNAIFSQKINMPFEVIIVDSESSDKTLGIASKFPVKIIRIRKKDFTYGRALNIGCNAAKGDYLVFLSAHAVPVNENWLNNLIKGFYSKRIAGVCSRPIPEKDCNLLTRRRMLSDYIMGKFSLSNAHSAVRKDIWKAMKFNESLPAAEDTDLAKRMQNKGYLIAYAPDAIVIHSHNENLRQIYNRYYKEIYGNLLIGRKEFVLWHLLDSFNNFNLDVRYILKNSHNPMWIIKSFVRYSVMFAAAVSAILKIKKTNGHHALKGMV